MGGGKHQTSPASLRGSVIPTAIRTNNQQTGRKTQHATATHGDDEAGIRNRGMFGSEWEEAVCGSGLLVQCLSIKYIRFTADNLIFAMN